MFFLCRARETDNDNSLRLNHNEIIKMNEKHFKSINVLHFTNFR